MYKDYFAFSELPFSIVPDPRYLYMSSRHREALAHLLYGVESDGGFVLLTGNVGTGKTTICRCLLENLPAHCDVAFIYNPKLTAPELLGTICEEFGIKHFVGDRSIKRLVDAINEYLLEGHAQGRKALLIIDEAQNLATEVLEQLRLLTNLETNERKLLQIILLGQPELQDILAGRELRQLAQRIVARYHLHPLSRLEVGAYVNHRLTIAGCGRQLFSSAVLWRIYHLSKGVPRVINLLCDRALLGTYTQGKDRVGHKTLSKAAREVFGERRTFAGLVRRIGWPALGFTMLGFAVLSIAYYQRGNPLSVAVERVVPETTAIATPVKNAGIPDPGTSIWPEGQAKAQSGSLAMAALFGLWGLSYKVQGGEPFCRQAANAGLSCLSERGGLSELRRRNLPAVLQLTDHRGKEFYVALTSLKGETAIIVLGQGVVKELPVSDLEKSWGGGYTLLWRAPPKFNGALKVGDKGESVAWLRQQIAKVNGRDADEKTIYDADLARQVKEFQVAEGLRPQGVAGPVTLIRLGARTDGNAPRLVN